MLKYHMATRKAKYGLKALIFLAKHSSNGPVLISKIAKDEGIPKKFLETILLELRKEGVLDSQRGKGWIRIESSGGSNLYRSGAASVGRPTRSHHLRQSEFL